MTGTRTGSALDVPSYQLTERLTLRQAHPEPPAKGLPNLTPMHGIAFIQSRSLDCDHWRLIRVVTLSYGTCFFGAR